MYIRLYQVQLVLSTTEIALGCCQPKRRRVGPLSQSSKCESLGGETHAPHKIKNVSWIIN